ncbi:PTS sugar transporter subunit IIA [Megamonas hypermegale]|uniref:PTS sugar transporter subunit IIA n=1 Tax=Megamonas hypermegale TaxID=158847 RepID=UPI0026ECCED9|nr:PTS sugar transporter subunit IIA [Megamonas hypermegale]
MKYVILVSHGKFAEGLANALSMLVGKREDIIAVGIEDGKSVDEFAELFTKTVDKITTDDEVVLLGDLIGGSPLTNAINVLNGKGVKMIIIGGMNLPVALTSVMMKDTFALEDLAQQVLQEAHGALREFKIEASDDDDDI